MCMCQKNLREYILKSHKELIDHIVVTQLETWLIGFQECRPPKKERKYITWTCVKCFVYFCIVWLLSLVLPSHNVCKTWFIDDHIELCIFSRRPCFQPPLQKPEWWTNSNLNTLPSDQPVHKLNQHFSLFCMAPHASVKRHKSIKNCGKRTLTLRNAPFTPGNTFPNPRLPRST